MTKILFQWLRSHNGRERYNYPEDDGEGGVADYRFRPKGEDDESYGDDRSWSFSYHAHFLISHHSKGNLLCPPETDGLRVTEREGGRKEDNVIPSQHKKVVSRRERLLWLFMAVGPTSECPSPTDEMMDIAKTRGERRATSSGNMWP